MEYKHTPVMVQEVIDHLAIKRGGYCIDCTLGSGAYTERLSKIVGSEGRVLSIDLDEAAILNTGKKNIKNVILVNDNFKNIRCVAEEAMGARFLFDAVVMDLGLSSYHLADRSRGFSFFSEESLDMAFGSTVGRSTEYIVNNYKESDLRRIFFEYGEENEAYKIAHAIVEERKIEPIVNAKILAQIITRAKRNINKKIHPATKVFQALRIETNDELGSLKKVLPDALELLKPGGRLAVVSFHSLEDRIVKDFFKRESIDCLCPPKLPVCVCQHKKSLRILTKKPMSASATEIANNPRARSAKLRVAEKL